MEDQFQKALDFANYKQTFSIQRKTLKEKASAKLTYGYAGGLFYIDRSLIAFVQMLIDAGRIDNVPIIDNNDNPVLIEDLTVFRDEIIDRYFAVTLEYYNSYSELKKNRSVEKIINL